MKLYFKIKQVEIGLERRFDIHLYLLRHDVNNVAFLVGNYRTVGDEIPVTFTAEDLASCVGRTGF